MYDVAVIGAGPAGSITAQRLAERGRRVVLLEDHPSAGTPVHCTGLLGIEAFDEFDLPRNLILGESASATMWGANGQSVFVQSAHVHATVIDRVGLDTTLARRAAAAGVEVRMDARAESVVVDAEHVRIDGPELGAGVRARACVLACGANYRFHRALSLGLPKLFLQSAQIETPFPATPEVEVRFGREVAPGGFAWMVPFRRAGVEYARIGLMSETRAGEHFTEFARSLCVRAGVDPATLPAPRLKMLPLAPVEKTYSDRVLAVGDAAGLVKPTTGGGIYYGLLSGAIAADVLDRGLQRNQLSARALRGYESRWRKKLGREIRVGLTFRKFASRLSDDSIDEIIDLARHNGILPLVQEKASFNWHSQAALALLGHPSFRRILMRTWTGTSDLI